MEQKATMRAIIYEKFGSPEVFQLKEISKPIPKSNEVLIRIYAASVQYADWAFLRGKPFIVRLIGAGFFRPKNKILGSDVAGRIESIGKNVKQIQIGDEVFGDLSESGWGGFAEYVAVPENVLALKPANLTFEEAAAIPQAGNTALQGLRDKGQIKTDQKVLINGASGGIGSFAVQIAKSYGTHVTGVCSSDKMDMVRSLGADHVINYRKEDFTKKNEQYDLIFDMVVNHSIRDLVRVLSPHGIYVAGAMSMSAAFLGPFFTLRGNKKVCSLAAKTSVKDLNFLKELIEVGVVKPIIDSCYPLSEVAKAVQHYGQRHAKGKVIIKMDEN